MADTIVPIGEEQGTTALSSAQAVTALSETGTGNAPAAQTTTTGTQTGTQDALAIDNAQLSETAQVVLLEQQGLTTTEIADELGIPQAEVESDLGAISAQQAIDNAQPTLQTGAQVTGAAAYSQAATAI